MTYGYWLEQAASDLTEAVGGLSRADQSSVPGAWRVVVHRNECAYQLTRLAYLLGAVASRRELGTPGTRLATAAVKDPSVKALLRVMPTRVDLPTAGSDSTRDGPADALRSASLAVSTAADILASHVDPVNGARTNEGAAIRAGAGRSAAVGDLADVVIGLARADKEFIGWLRRAMQPLAREHLSLYQDLTLVVKRTDIVRLVALAEVPRRPGLVRSLEVAPVPDLLGRARIPDTIGECLALLDEFRVWAFRCPQLVGGKHLSAATRIGLMIAVCATPPSSAALRAWQQAVRVLGDLGSHPNPASDELRSAELIHIADLLRGDRHAMRQEELAALADRLPNLANTLDTMTRRLIRAGLLMSKHVRLDPSAKRGAIVPASGRWTTATFASASVVDLLAAFRDAAGDELHAQPNAPRAFRPLRQVRAQEPLGQPNPPALRVDRIWHR